MIYLKKFEELVTNNRNIDFTRISDDRYEFTTDDLTYVVDFTNAFINEYKSCWSRQYDIKGNKEIGYHQSNRNPYKIISTVTEITKDFLEEKDVEVLMILHVLMEREVCSIDKLNKRAKINYQYLKSIDNYQLRYFNLPSSIHQNESVSTNCIMFKSGVDISPIIEKWNKYRNHFEVVP